MAILWLCTGKRWWREQMCHVRGLLGAGVGAFCIPGFMSVWCKRDSTRAPSGLLPVPVRQLELGTWLLGFGQWERSLSMLFVSRLLPSELGFISSG